MISAAFVAPLLLFLLPGTALSDNVMIDLSKDLITASLDNPGAKEVEQVASSDPMIRTALVLEKGRVVADYVRDDVDPNEPAQVFSVTKSWTGLLMGIMVNMNLISLEETLGDIWPEESGVWTNVSGADFRRNVTIESLLTMTSGLIDPAGGLGIAFLDGDGLGGASLEDSLAWPDIGDEPGVWSYLTVSNILSYVIQERTGMSPRAYLAESVLPALGISNDEMDWWQNEDNMEFSYHGLLLTNRQMAKFGQLYLQEGMASPSVSVVSSDWARNSTTEQVSYMLNVSGVTLSGRYGYLMFIWDGRSINLPGAGDFFCAVGLGGQDICVHPELERVVVQQRDLDANIQANLVIAPIAFDESVTFEDSSETSQATSAASRCSLLGLTTTLTASLVVLSLSVW